MTGSRHVLSSALLYAGAGIHVFPVKGDKTPHTEHGFKVATTDRETIEEWWRQWPDAGIATPDFDVLDVDLYKPGAEKDWQQIRRLIPKTTPQTRTPRGGLQFFFQPGTLKSRKFADGIDLRYAGRNYVLLPPSEFAGHGRYTFIVKLVGGKLTPAPDFPQAKPRAGTASPVDDKIPYGRQHYELVSIAGTMRRRGLSADEIFAALWQVNINRCERPGPPENIRQIAESVATYTPAATPQPNQEPEPSTADSRPWQSVTWSAFRDTAPPAHTWLIDGLLPAGALAFVAGPPKRGKTWVGISIALALALGKAFADGFEIPTQRNVLYIALEGSQTGLRTRIGALARGAGADPDSNDLECLHMLYRPRPFDLAELATAEWLLQEAEETDAALIIVDVLRAAARFQENAAEDFARIRDHLDPLLQAQRTVALLHHFGKLNDTQKERSPGERMAGTGAMYGALDVGFLIVTSEDGARRLKVELEARDFAAPDAIDLAIQGNGTGKHGGFRYDDTATVAIVEVEESDYLVEVEELLADEEWRTGDELAHKLGRKRTVLEEAIKDDGRRRKELGEPPRIVRWDRDGRELGKAWNARPWGTPTMYEKARSDAGPSQPSLLDPDLARSLGPPTGGHEGPSDQAEGLPPETERDEP